MAHIKKKPRFAALRIGCLLLVAALLIGAIALIFLLESPEKNLFAPPETEAAATENPEDPQRGLEQRSENSIIARIAALFADNSVNQTDEITFGIDVARYQGTIDWEKVAASGVDFAMVRVGYRAMISGEITPDPNARYNMQEAQKYGIKLGAYFFSTPVTKAEAIEEAKWVADYISQYRITYPVAYNCEGFNDPENRQYPLSKTERTDIALAFLEAIENLGYEAMFYASKNEMEGDAQWEVSRIEPEYKIWVAQYPEQPYPETARSTYTGTHHMWQYTRNGQVDGVPQGVDVNIAYFGYDGTSDAKNDEAPEIVEADVEALMDFEPVSETVTAKKETNLRNIPSQGEDATVVYTLKNGETATRVGISPSGWSKLEWNGETVYAVSSYLTTDLGGKAAEAPTEDDGIETEFTPVSDRVTAKEVVNLRTVPSVTDADSQVIAQLKHGEVITRTGINEALGWSRVEYNGRPLYCVSSYLEIAE